MQSFPSKIDAWMAVLMAVLAVGVFIATPIELLTGAPHLKGPLLLGACVMLLPFWVLADTRYVLDHDQLLIRSGPFRWRIPITDITSVVATRDPASGPALSFDRLRVSYGRGRAIMISPADKDAFLHALESRRRRGAGKVSSH